MTKPFRYLEDMGDFMDLEESPESLEDTEINVDFCKCSECQGEFMLDEDEVIDKCPECGASFDDQKGITND